MVMSKKESRYEEPVVEIFKDVTIDALNYMLKNKGMLFRPESIVVGINLEHDLVGSNIYEILEELAARQIISQDEKERYYIKDENTVQKFLDDFKLIEGA